MPTLLDVLVVVIVALAVFGGWRSGGAVVAARTAGLVLGFVAGLWAAGLLSASLSPVAHLLLGCVCVLGGLLLGAAVGRLVGRAIGGALHRAGAGTLDRLLGALTRGLVALVACWLLAAFAVSFAPARWADAVRGSALLTVDGSTPIAGQVTTALRAVSPGDLAALVPASGGVGPAAATISRADRAVSAAVFKVLARGADSTQDVSGTAFVAARGLLVTNAHVVRGATSVSVATGSGELDATTVLLDRRADLAVLRVDGLDADPLPFASADVANGSDAVIVGFPSGRPRTAIGAVVLQRMPIPTPGLTDGLALHQAYRLRAAIRHGNSGSPLLDPSGRVVGVVNALSGSAGRQGYATTLDELLPDLARAAGATEK